MTTRPTRTTVPAAALAAALALGALAPAGGALAQQPRPGIDAPPAAPRIETQRPPQAQQRPAAPGEVRAREGAAQPRTGPAQREAEIAKTTLLNRFGQLGFSRLLSFEERGEEYVAQVLTRSGATATVVIDAASGEIYERR
jgi:hypothetical protein